MLVSEKFTLIVETLFMCDVSLVNIDLLELGNFLFFQVNRTCAVFHDLGLFFFKELKSLFLTLLQGFQCFAVLGTDLILFKSRFLLLLSDPIFDLINLVLQYLLLIHALKHELLRVRLLQDPTTDCRSRQDRV